MGTHRPTCPPPAWSATSPRPAPPLPLSRASTQPRTRIHQTRARRRLGIDPSCVPSLISRHRLPATGQGKARRFPRETVEALRRNRGRGVSIKTANEYLSDIKAFMNFMILDRLAAENPIAHLRKLNGDSERRHDRRILDEAELARAIAAAEHSATLFRGLAGPDRARSTASPPFPAFAAPSSPSSAPGTSTSMPRRSPCPAPSRKTRKRHQPLPAEIAPILRDYLAGKKKSDPVWPGTWHEPPPKCSAPTSKPPASPTS